MTEKQTEESTARNWEAAYRWLCQRRQYAPPNADVWELRFKWPHRKVQWFNGESIDSHPWWHSSPESALGAMVGIMMRWC